MVFRTIVDIAKPAFAIEPCEQMLFVGSCFADSIGSKFRHEGFPAVVNPYGTMYNPVSVRHTVEHWLAQQPAEAARLRTVFMTLGTNHVYRLRLTGEVVDNCQKRPQQLFQEQALSVGECAYQLRQAISLLRRVNPDVRVVLTVSPIRYRKYGFHESQLSKSTLLLAADELVAECDGIAYFPAYEIVMDELRDYRFYAADMLHPSEQAVCYIWERLADTFFSENTRKYLEQWRPLRQALGHCPSDPSDPAYIALMKRTHEQIAALRLQYPTLDTSCYFSHDSLTI